MISLSLIAWPASASAAEQPPSPGESFSAIDCLQKAGGLLDRPLNMLTLLNSNTLAIGGDCTAQDIADLAIQQKLSAVVLPSITTDQIARCPFPIVLHVNGGKYSTKLDDFILCMGVRDGSVHLFCPPGSHWK